MPYPNRKPRPRGAEGLRAAARRPAARRVPAAVPASQLTYIKRAIKVYEVLDEEGLALIENNADTVLEEIGIIFRDDPEALAHVEGSRRRREGRARAFPEGPAALAAEDRAVDLHAACAQSRSARCRSAARPPSSRRSTARPSCATSKASARYATIEDFRNFVKLAYMAPSMHHSGGTVCEPVDVPVNKRHLDMVYSHIKYSDKPFMGSVTAPERAEDTVAMAKIVFGDDFVENNTVLT